jgi:hypothetical protein
MVRADNHPLLYNRLIIMDFLIVSNADVAERPTIKCKIKL